MLHEENNNNNNNNNKLYILGGSLITQKCFSWGKNVKCKVKTEEKLQKLPSSTSFNYSVLLEHKKYKVKGKRRQDRQIIYRFPKVRFKMRIRD